MAPRAVRLVLIAAAAGTARAGDKELEVQLRQLEQELRENQAQIKALEGAAEAEHARQLNDANMSPNAKPSIFGDGPGTRSYRADESFVGAMNHAWLIICGSLVMFMQAGFALLEAGTCRRKFVQNILLKNLTDVAVGTLGWWSFGWSFAYSGPTETIDGTDYKDNGFIGYEEFFAHHFTVARADGQQEPSNKMVNWFFQWAFASAAATIVSGGVAERMKFPGYCIYSFLLTSFVYPVIVAWTWGYGFLAKVGVGYMDFAGSGIVHMTGGIGALVGSVIAGQREGPDGKRFKSPMMKFEPILADGEVDEFAPHNMALVAFGTLILWFGWYGFNCGSTLAMDGIETGYKAAHVAMTTTLAASVGGLTAFCLRYVLIKKYDVGAFCNGILAGLVSITAPCSNVDHGVAIVIGILGALIYQGASSLLKLVKIDDPLDAFPIHGACGAWGVFAAALFDWGHAFKTVHGWNGFKCVTDTNGACKGDGGTDAVGGELIGANLLEILVICAWTAAFSGMIFLPLKAVGWLVATPEEQREGFDEAKHTPTKAYDYSQMGRSLEQERNEQMPARSEQERARPEENNA